jgi:DNA primase
MIKQETIDKIFDSVDVYDVIKDFVKLTKKGVNYTGLCPFHNEKTPSFIVSPTKNLYKCFGCGEGGNSVSFLMKSQNMSYPEALKHLAQKYNIIIEEEKEVNPEAASKKELKQQLIEFNSFVAAFYANELFAPKDMHQIALHYIQKRFTEESIKLWSLGYASVIGSRLYNAAKRANYEDAFLLNTGLFRQDEKTGRYYDFFRDRIIFPVADKHGNIISFSARSLPGADKRYAKYMNLGDTALYKKRFVLYGINFAIKTISKTGSAILVEGNPDVVKMHEIDISNTIAPSGTALTTEQLRQIKRLTDRIILLFDGDDAGQNALRKNGKLCIAEGLIPYAAVLPADQDPDTFFTDKVQAEKWIEENKTDYLTWYSNSLFEKAGQDPSLKNDVVNEISGLLIHLNTSQRDIYIEQISKQSKLKGKLFIDALKDLELAEPTAKQSTDEILPPGVDPYDYDRWGFYHHNNEYHFKTKEGRQKLSNFIMKPIFHIDSVMDPKRIYELINAKGFRVVVNLDMQEMTSLQAFQRSVEGKGNFMFTGMMSHFQKLKGKLYEETRTCTEIKNLGWQKEGFWAWANGITTPDGAFTPIDEYGVCRFNEEDYFIPAFSKIYIRDKSIFQEERKFQYKESTLDLDVWLSLFIKIHGDNGMIVFAFYLATLFMDAIFYQNDNFPILDFFGQKGSGKNTLAYSIQALFGKRQSEFNIHNGTIPGLASHLEAPCNAVAVIDEFKNNIDFVKIETIKEIYNHNGRSRMNMDKKKKEQTPVNVTVIMMGQEMPTIDPALFERFIFLQFLSKEGLSQEKKKDFQNLQNMERDGLSHITHRFLKHRKYFVEFYKENYDKVIHKLTEDTKGEDISERIIRNTTTILSAFKTMEDKVSFVFDYKLLYTYSLKTIREQNAQIKQSDEIGVFWSLLEAMFDDNILIDKWHFRVDHLGKLKTFDDKEFEWEPQGKRVLRFKFNAIAKIYSENIRRRGDKGLPQDSLKHYLKTSKAFIGIEKSCQFIRRDYIAAEGKAIENKQTTSAMCFDYDLLKINLERIDTQIEAINSINGEAKKITETQTEIVLAEKDDDMPF